MKQNLKTILIILGILALTVVALNMLGHSTICPCGYLQIWGGIAGEDTSQHFFDYYTYSHVIHGMAFFFLLWLFARKIPMQWKLTIAVLIEAGWEILENSPIIINRYREHTIALDYYGDSIVNSISDIGAMIFGFWLASKLPVWVVIALVVVLELVVLYLIRNNLTLNILMLVYPLDAIRRWQAGE